MKKRTKRLLIIIVSVVAVIAAVAVGFAVYIRSETVADEITLEEAQGIIDDALKDMTASNTRKSMAYIASNISVTANSLDYGTEKDIRVSCTVKSIDTETLIKDNIAALLDVPTEDENGMKMTSTKIKMSIDPILLSLLETAEIGESSAELVIYQTKNGYELYTSKDAVNAIFGNIAAASDYVSKLGSVTIGTEQIKAESNLKTGLTECISLSYETTKPDTSVYLVRQWNSFVAKFRMNFIEGARWQYLTTGLLTTLQITVFAVLLGIVLGFLVAIVRCTNEKIGKLKFLNAICKIYLTVIRGTPVLVQLMIIYFVIFMPLNINKILAAVICFGLNSGAYVAEIVRGGIMSIDNGQFEAGRSLGFNYIQTMWYIILPQAFKAVLPALANEFIVLLKETSVASYIGINDLTRGGDIIRGITFTAFLPLIAVALIYLVIVVGLTKLVSLLERRLRRSDRG